MDGREGEFNQGELVGFLFVCNYFLRTMRYPSNNNKYKIKITFQKLFKLPRVLFLSVAVVVVVFLRFRS